MQPFTRLEALVVPVDRANVDTDAIIPKQFPIKLDERIVQDLFDLVARPSGLQLAIDLAAQTIRPAGGDAIPFEIEAERKRRLLNGLDDVALTLSQADRIREYERVRRAREPWLFS